MDIKTKIARHKTEQKDASHRAKAIKAEMAEWTAKAKASRINREKAEEALKALKASFPHLATTGHASNSRLPDAAQPGNTVTPATESEGIVSASLTSHGIDGHAAPSTSLTLKAQEEVQELSARLKQLQTDRSKLNLSGVPQVRVTLVCRKLIAQLIQCSSINV